MLAIELRSNDENGLDRLSAGGSVLLGLFLLAGASGHLIAVRPQATGEGSLMMLLPGLVLLAAAAFSLVGAIGLWRGQKGWQWTALVVNAVLAVYLTNLLITGVPDHPIGVFLALVCSQMAILSAVLAGLKWRTPDA